MTVCGSLSSSSCSHVRASLSKTLNPNRSWLFCRSVPWHVMAIHLSSCRDISPKINVKFNLKVVQDRKTITKVSRHLSNNCENISVWAKIYSRAYYICHLSCHICSTAHTISLILYTIHATNNLGAKPETSGTSKQKCLC